MMLLCLHCAPSAIPKQNVSHQPRPCLHLAVGGTNHSARTACTDGTNIQKNGSASNQNADPHKKRRIPKLNRRSVMQKKPRGAIIQRSMTCHTSSCHDSPRQTSLLYQPSNSTVKYTSPPHRQLPRQPHERLIRSAHLSQHLTCPGVFELSAGIVQRHAERPPVALRRDIEHRIHHHRLAD